jgi:hypothetical protein
MQEAIREVTPRDSTSQSEIEEVSFIRVALFGLFIPPSLGALGFLLFSMANLSALPQFGSLFGIILYMYFLLLIICAPFGVSFALFCGFLMRVLFRRGKGLMTVQRHLCFVGVVCGFMSLCGAGGLVNLFLDGRWNPQFILGLPRPFWGTALLTGAVCGWMLPRVARLSRSIGVQPVEK